MLLNTCKLILQESPTHLLVVLTFRLKSYTCQVREIFSSRHDWDF